MNMALSLGLKRFARYAAVGGSTFMFDLGMLYIAVSLMGIAYYIATPITFLIAVSCNYVLSRQLVFKGTLRSWHIGYLYFALMAIGGAVATTAIVAVLVSHVGLYYLLARIIASCFVGMANYLFNLYVNFRVVGVHEG